MGCPGMTPVTLPPGKPGRFLFHLAVQFPRRRAACFGGNNRYPAPPRRVLQLPSSAIKPWSCPAWDAILTKASWVAFLFRIFWSLCLYLKARATKGRDMSIIRPSQLFKITAFSFFICVGNSVPCFADQQSIPPAKAIEFEGDLAFTPKPLTLKGYLRRPDRAGRYPAIVLLHGCGGSAERLDQRWGQILASWGYVTLTIDSFGPRGIENTCGNYPPRDLRFDAYRGLNFLVRQPFVDAKRIVAIGFSLGGWLGPFSAERGAIEQLYENKFRAAVAYYPACDTLKGIATVPSLILIGERDV